MFKWTGIESYLPWRVKGPCTPCVCSRESALSFTRAVRLQPLASRASIRVELESFCDESAHLTQVSCKGLETDASSSNGSQRLFDKDSKHGPSGLISK